MNPYGFKYLLWFCSISLCSLSCYAQNDPNELDSLLQVLQTSVDPEEKGKVHSRVAWLNIIKDIDYAKAHLDSSLLFYNQINNERGIANVNYRFGVLYRFAGEYDKALEYANLYQSYSEEINDTLALANICYQKGVIYSQSGDYQSSLNEYFNCLRFYENLNDSSSRAFTLNSIGIVYKNLNKYKEAEESYLEAISLLEPIDDKNNLADVYHSLGTLYATQKKHEKALEYFNKTLAIGIELNRDWGIAKDYSSIGLVYLSQNQLDLSLEYLQKAYAIYEENKYEEDLTETMMNLGKVYLSKEDFYEAERYLLKASERGSESLNINKNIHYELYQLYSQKGIPAKSLHHHEIYANYKDSLYREENIKSINNLQLQYETEKKDSEIAQGKLALEQKEVMILKKKNQFYIALGSGILLLLTLLALWIFFRQRQLVKTTEIENLKSQRVVTKLEALIEGEEKERKRLAEDLHDGINGDLSVIKYKIDAIELEKLSSEEVGELKGAVELLDNAIQQVRNISHNLAPPSLQNFSLIEAIHQFCQKMSSSSGLEIKFQSFGNPVKLNIESETAIYRMIQELINNIVKHAEATEAIVQINHHTDTLDITVEDNGKGYDTQINHQGIGLKNVYSRASLLKTELNIDSNEQGTSSNIHIDLSKLNYD